jgi:hypothetical protein
MNDLDHLFPGYEIDLPTFWQVVDGLPEKPRWKYSRKESVKLRLAADGTRLHTFEEIAESMGLQGRERARHIFYQAVRMLRHPTRLGKFARKVE